MTAAAGPNATALRRDAVVERVALFGLRIPALLLVTITMIIPVVWLFWLRVGLLYLFLVLGAIPRTS